MQDFLVIKTSSLGDILQTLPSVLSLKKKYPEAKVSWVIEKRFSSILELFPIDDLIIVDFKKWKKEPFKSYLEIKSFIKKLRLKKYDFCIDFQANTKSGLLMAFVKAFFKISFLTPAEWPHRLFKAKRIAPSFLSCHSYYHSLIKDLVENIDYDLPIIEPSTDYKDFNKIIMLGLGSMWASKKLDISQIKALMKEASQNQEVYFIIPALESEKTLYETLFKEGYQGKVLIKKHLIDYLPDLKASDYFIGVDSAFLHLARLFKIPSKGYFGPSSASFYGQSGDEMGLCPYNITFIKRCPRLRSCKAPCMRSHLITFKK